MANKQDVAEIQGHLKPLLGQKPWRVATGLGTSITMEFGKPIMLSPKAKTTNGEWSLWISTACWRLETSEEVLVGSGDAQDKVEFSLKQMENLSLQTIELFPPSLETTFNFENGKALRVFPTNSQGEICWQLLMPGRNALAVGPNCSWVFEKA